MLIWMRLMLLGRCRRRRQGVVEVPAEAGVDRVLSRGRGTLYAAGVGDSSFSFADVGMLVLDGTGWDGVSVVVGATLWGTEDDDDDILRLQWTGVVVVVRE